MSQVRLAKAARVGRTYIVKLESGEKKNPSLEVLQKLAKALGRWRNCWNERRNHMTRDGFNEIPTDEYKALYGVYLACLDARVRGEKLPKGVSDAMPDVKQAYAAQGTDEYGTAGAR